MKIFLAYPSVNLTRWVNYGIAALCGVMRDKGHNVTLYHPTKLDRNELKWQICGGAYDLFLVSSVTNQWPYALDIIRTIKHHSAQLVVVGGHHVTNVPGVIEETPEIDIICIGEGDVALGELIDKLESGADYTSIPSLLVRDPHDGKRIIRNAIGMLVEDLGTLPMPDFTVFSKEAIFNRPSLILSRGCPYDCTYCCNNSLRLLYKGKGTYVRKKSVERAIAETLAFVGNYHPHELNFDDDTFIKDKKWLARFLEEYKKKINIPFNCNSRAETLDDAICARLKDAGCQILCIGIESGSEKFRRERYNRRMSNETLVNAFGMLRRHGIQSYAFNMVGAPDETFGDYLSTVALNRLAKPDGSQITIFYPYPGSELYNYAKKQGLLGDEEFADDFTSKPMLQMKQFPKWKVSLAASMFHYLVWAEGESWKTRVAYLLTYVKGRLGIFFRRRFGN